MGQVYRATDTRLKRQVAIKILAPSFALDADRLARFQREAEVLASLNHPHIAAIYGLEDAGGANALVMEFVEGEDLSARIARGPIPLDEALPIARQIAEALEAAHELGVIHRDLKPANVKVRPDGTVKVLDFGLAKAMEPPAASSPSVSRSPTLTTPAMTQVGTLLGTAAYMSPEQARGKPVDKRADIWAFGAVLFEMVTGQRAFPGDDVADVLASVLAREPDWTRLPAGLSPVLRSYLTRCLHKDVKQRVRDIGDVLLALDRAFEIAPAEVAQSAAAPPPWWRRALPAAITAAIAMLITALIAWSVWPSAERRAATRFDYVLPDGQQLAVTLPQRPVMAISPDGRSFVYQTSEGLYLRSMATLDAQLIPGTTERLSTPFFSPDGRWVGYFVSIGQSNDRQLKKIAVGGGAPVTLCAVTVPFGASWAADNTIVFGQRGGIMRVSANGGTPELIIHAGDGEQMYGPQLLPGGVAVLVSVTRGMGPARWNQAQVVAHSLTTGQRTVVAERGDDAHYLPSGHVVYAVGDGLFGVTFDAAHSRVTGGAIPLVQGVHRPVGVSTAAANYAVSEQGTLIYLTQNGSARSLVWMNRDGAAAAPIGSIPSGAYEDPRLSPDGGRVLVTRDGDIWIYDIATGRSSRLTRDGFSLMGAWDPAGSRIAYSSAGKGNLEAWIEPADGSGPPRQLTTLGGQIHVDAWSPDGRTLTIHRHPPEGSTAILMLPVDAADATPRAFLNGDFNAEGAEFSPDGRYVAYVAELSGQREIYIKSYADTGAQMTVSVGGGREPVWANNGDLFYRSLTGDRMFVVSVTTDPALRVGKPVQLFEGSYYVSPTGSPRPQYDVTRDGQRFLLLASASGTSASLARPRIVVVQDWFDELRRLVPTR